MAQRREVAVHQNPRADTYQFHVGESARSVPAGADRWPFAPPLDEDVDPVSSRKRTKRASAKSCTCWGWHLRDSGPVSIATRASSSTAAKAGTELSMHFDERSNHLSDPSSYFLIF
jgi:hypothetical protein